MPSPREADLFADALERPAAARGAFLDAACAGDATLRARLEDLLAAHASAPTYLDESPASHAALHDEQPGDRIGRYKLLQKIGEGGCGAVWMAEQEEPVRRRVALKIIKLGMDTKTVIARFEAERQALALMDHPNIAKVFDAGATATGRPFFVMELVRGVPITRYCDEQNLATPERLRIFAQVCHAIQHAHQKGIIHRDIKPSNILVALDDDVAMPKVIDFGIAKATQGRLTDATLFTALDQFIGTPAYMSPEQANLNALDVDTRSDIYSLGVLLYELLTDRTPFDTKELLQAGLDEVRRQIREVEPPTPSTRLSTLQGEALTNAARHRQTSAPKLASLVRGDLDWIVMRCLEKDRRRRYETANDLAADIHRHLRDEAVLARPPSAGYKLHKLIRKHRTAFAAASAVTGALILGLGLATWAFFQERAARERAVAAEREQSVLRQQAETARANEAQQRARAEADAKTAVLEAARREQFARFMKDMLKGVEPGVALGRDTKLLHDILDDTAQRLKKTRPDQPEVEAEVRTTLGTVYGELGDLDAAEAMHREALALHRRIGGASAGLATTLQELGGMHVTRGKFAEAEPLLREAVEMQRTLPKGNGVVAAKVLATCLLTSGRSSQAEALLREQLAFERKRWGEDDLKVADALGALAYVLRLDGKWGAAATAHRDELALRRKSPATTDEALARALNLFGQLLLSSRHLAEAESVFREALALQRKRSSHEHPDLAECLDQFAELLAQVGKFGEAEAMCREAAEMRRRLFGGESSKLCLSLQHLGSVLIAAQRWSEAEAPLREALAIQRKLKLESFASALLPRLIQVLEHRGDLAGAEAVSRELVQNSRQVYGPGSPMVVVALSQLGMLLRKQGKSEAAVAIDREATALSAEGGADGLLADAMRLSSGRAAQLLRDNQFAEAAAAAREELAQHRVQKGLESAEVAMALQIFSMALARQANWAEAEPAAREALELWRKLRGEQDLQFSLAALTLGTALTRQGKPTEAETVLRAALAPAKHGPLSLGRTFYPALAQALRAQRRDAEVEPLWRDAIAYARERYGAESRDLADCVRALGMEQMRVGRLADATASSRDELQIREKLAPDNLAASAARAQLGRLLVAQGHFAEAEPLLLASYDRLKTRTDDPARLELGALLPSLITSFATSGRSERFHDRAALAELETIARELIAAFRTSAERLPLVSSVMRGVVDLMNKQGRGAEAEPIARECLEIRRKTLPASQWQIYGALSAVGESLLTQKKYVEAEPLLIEAYAEMIKRTPTPITAPFNASIGRTASGLVELYTATNEPAKAAAWREKLGAQKDAAP